jgi:hypothetical protein
MNKERVTEREFLEEMVDLIGYALEKDDKNILARAYGRIEEQLCIVKEQLKLEETRIYEDQLKEKEQMRKDGYC